MTEETKHRAELRWRAEDLVEFNAPEDYVAMMDHAQWLSQYGHVDCSPTELIDQTLTEVLTAL